jgi:hypothetical protein
MTTLVMPYGRAHRSNYSHVPWPLHFFCCLRLYPMPELALDAAPAVALQAQGRGHLQEEWGIEEVMTPVMYRGRRHTVIAAAGAHQCRGPQVLRALLCMVLFS